MSGLPWFRMYVDFLDDPKMIGLAFEDQRHFIGVLALKASGALDHDAEPRVIDRIVAQRLWVDYAVVDEVKRRLTAARLIDDDWQPLAWGRRQMRSDRDPTAAERQARKREKDAAERRSREAEKQAPAPITRDVTRDITGESRGQIRREVDTDTETEKQTCPSVPDELVPVQRKKEKPAPTREQEIAIVNAYLSALPTWPTVTSARWGKSRARDALLAVWAREPDVRKGDFWPRFFATVKRQRFWNTGNEGRPIDQARFSWLMTPSKFAAVVELMDEQEASR